MEKKILGGIVIGFFTISATNAVYGTTLKTYEFTITGEQLMSYTTANGTDGSSAVDNGLYDGARLFRNYDDAGGSWGTYDRSYHASSQGAFTNWAATSGDRLVDFNLWGYDGNGAKWGEVYKVYDWANTPTSSDADWDGYTTAWPWGSFDDYADGKSGYGDHYNDGELLGWATDYNYTNGLGFGAGQADATFTFQMTLNMDDPAFGASSPWYNGQEGQMVFWFGGWTQNANLDWTGLYEGNIILEGNEVAPVPEPATMLLFGTGLAGLIGIRTRKKKENT